MVDIGSIFLFLGLSQLVFSVTTHIRQNVPLHPNTAVNTRNKLTLLDAYVPSSNSRDQWFDKSRLITLEGLASAKLNSNFIATTIDQRKFLRPGDFVILVDNPLLVKLSVTKETAPESLDDSFEVLSVRSDGIIVDRPWPNESSDRLYLFKVRSSADSVIRRVRMERPNHTTSATTTTTTTTTTKTTTTTTEDPCHHGTPVPGLALIRDSRVVTTSNDVRDILHEGEWIIIEGTKFVVTEPRDAITFSLSKRYSGPSVSGVTGCKPPDNETSPCITLSGCVSLLNRSHVVRTSKDIRREIEPGHVIRILWRPYANNNFESTVVHPVDEQTLTIAGPWDGPDVKCIKACRLRFDWDSDGRVELCGTVATTAGSPVVYTSCDLRNVLNEHDWVRIGTESVVISHPFTDKVMTMSTRLQTTASDVKAYKLATELPLPGTLSVVEGSATVTTTADLRDMVGPGDLIRVYQKPMRIDRFEVALPQDMYTLTLSKPHPGPTAAGLRGVKMLGTSVPLSGHVDVVSGSHKLRTSMDLTGELSAGDSVRIADADNLVVSAVTPTSVTLKSAWPGVSSPGLKLYRSGKSAELLTLEALAREKLKCTTVYCLSQIELREAALPFDYPRTLSSASIPLPTL